jgi:hypothetical protein
MAMELVHGLIKKYTMDNGLGIEKLVYPNGATYEGQFFDDDMKRNGKFCYANGNIYIGNM